MNDITIRYADRDTIATAETLAAALAAVRKTYPDAVDVSGDWAHCGNGRVTRQIVESDADDAPVVAELSRVVTTEPAKLTKGERYDVDALKCVDWTGDDTGLNCWAYFADGVYLGPDADGVEPLFVVR